MHDVSDLGFCYTFQLILRPRVTLALTTYIPFSILCLPCQLSRFAKSK